MNMMMMMKYITFSFRLILLKVKCNKDGNGNDFATTRQQVSAKWNHHVCRGYPRDNEGRLYRKVDSHNHVISVTVIWCCW